MATIHTQHSVGREAAHEGRSTTDLASHQRTFDGFVTMIKWNVIAIVAILIFMALANA